MIGVTPHGGASRGRARHRRQLTARLAGRVAAARLPRRGAARPARPDRAGRRASCPSRWASRCVRASTPRATPPLAELEADYVDTFDNRRRHNLFLTYFAHGDTRKRGMALLRFKQTYLASGLRARPTTSCPTTSASCWSSPPPSTTTAGAQLLLDHRAGLELLRLALGRGRLAVGRRRRGGHAPRCRRCEGDELRRGPPARRRGAARGGGRPRRRTPPRPSTRARRRRTARRRCRCPSFPGAR